MAKKEERIFSLLSEVLVTCAGWTFSSCKEKLLDESSFSPNCELFPFVSLLLPLAGPWLSHFSNRFGRLIYSCSPHHSSDYIFGWTTIGLLLMTMQLAYRKRQGVFLSSKKFQVSSFRALSQWWGGRAAWGSEWPADPNVSLLPLWLRCRPHTSSPFHFSVSVCKMIRCSKRGRRHICEQS